MAVRFSAVFLLVAVSMWCTNDATAEETTALAAEIEALKCQNSALKDLLIDKSNVGGSSVFVRWGNDGCPSTTETVYTGVMAGSHYKYSGGAANLLCLPLNPTFTSSIREPEYGSAKLYSVEYESRPHASNDMDGVCSVCRVAKATSLMVPATNECPEGWDHQYSGYLMAGKPNAGRVSTEYICVDEAMAGREGTKSDRNEGVIYFTKYVCQGSLPCPPFSNGGIVTCAMCSK